MKRIITGGYELAPIEFRPKRDPHGCFVDVYDFRYPFPDRMKAYHTGIMHIDNVPPCEATAAPEVMVDERQPA